MEDGSGGRVSEGLRSPDAVGVARSFRYCPQCGSAAEDDLDDGFSRSFECKCCGYILYFNPGSAVAAILSAPDGRVLFLRRQRDPGKGMLGLPGGFIDPKEQAEAALTREVREEVGLVVNEWRYLASYPNLYRYRGLAYHVTDMFFVCSIRNFDGVLLDLSESAAWLAIDPAEALGRETFAFESNRLAVEAFVDGK